MDNEYKLYALGNALVDFEFNLTDQDLLNNNIEKGLMTLVDEDLQKKLWATFSEKYTKKSCGGSAANTAIAFSQLGLSAFYSCKVASDETGNFYLNDLLDNGVKPSLEQKDLGEGTTGKCFVFTTPDAQRSMNTYLGVSSTFSREQINFELLKKSSVIYIEGYLVTSDSAKNAVIEVLDFAKSNSLKTALTLSDPGIVKFFKNDFMNLLKYKLDYIFCNLDEALEITSSTSLHEASKKMQNFSDHVVITNGKEGCRVIKNGNYIDAKAISVEAKDTNGAGDMFAGAYLFGQLSGYEEKKCAELANILSSEVVQKYGPRLEKNVVKSTLEEFLK